MAWVKGSFQMQKQAFLWRHRKLNGFFRGMENEILCSTVSRWDSFITRTRLGDGKSSCLADGGFSDSLLKKKETIKTTLSLKKNSPQKTLSPAGP